MMGKSYKTIEKLCVYAKKNKIKVAFNPSSYLTKKGLVYLKKILSLTTFLVLNREEAEDIIGMTNIKKLLRGLHKIGPKIVAITNGKDGVYVYDSKHYYHLPANTVKIKETTGAGDAFGSGFLAGLILKDVLYGVHLGTANATSVIKYMGAKNKLLNMSEARKQIKKNHRIKPLK